MPKLLKFTLFSVLALSLLFTLAIGGLIIFIDPNDYKNEIAEQVKNVTGRQLTIKGDIEYSLFPWIGISLGKTELSNAKGFGDQPFASVGQVDINVKLVPLFQKRLEMKKIRLLGLQAYLAKDPSGLSNWADLARPSTSTETATTEKAPETAPKGNETPESARAMGALAALAIEGLELMDAHIEWNDQQANQHIVIDKLTLQTGPLALPAPVDLSLSMDFQLNQPKIKDHVEFSGQVNANLAEQMIGLNKLQLSTLGMTLSGQININELDKIPKASGQIQLANVSPRELTGKLGIQLPKTSDPTVLQKANANIEFSANPNQANLSRLTLVIDDTQLTGTARINDFESPVIRFNLHASNVDVDRYMPPATDGSSQEIAPAPTPGAAAVATGQLNLEPVRNLDIEGNISLDKMTVIGARLTDIKLGIKGKGGQIHLSPAKASLYNGLYEGDIKLDVRTDTPKVSVNETLKGINVGPLLKDVLDDDLVSGKATITAQLTTSGTELTTIKKTLNGKASFSFRDGKIKGINIGQVLREGYAKLNKKPVPPKTENETDFAELSGSITATNGIVSNNDLSAKSPLLRVSGKGHVDLPNNRIKYLLTTAIVESNEGQTGRELEELKSYPVPIKITGKLTDPKIFPDFGTLIQNRAKKEIEKKKTAIKKEAEEKIEAEKKKAKKKLEDKLKKLLKF